MKMPPVILGNC